MHVMGTICEDMEDSHNEVEGANFSSYGEECDVDDDSNIDDPEVGSECSGDLDMGEVMRRKETFTTCWKGQKRERVHPLNPNHSTLQSKKQILYVTCVRHLYREDTWSQQFYVFDSLHVNLVELTPNIPTAWIGFLHSYTVTPKQGRS